MDGLAHGIATALEGSVGEFPAIAGPDSEDPERDRWQVRPWIGYTIRSLDAKLPVAAQVTLALDRVSPVHGLEWLADQSDQRHNGLLLDSQDAEVQGVRRRTGEHSE